MKIILKNFGRCDIIFSAGLDGRLPLERGEGDAMTKYELISLILQGATLVATLLNCLN